MNPCPFCGETSAILVQSPYPYSNSDSPLRVVRCLKCNAEGPHRHGAEEAADAWDRRIDAPRARRCYQLRWLIGDGDGDGVLSCICRLPRGHVGSHICRDHSTHPAWH